VVEKVVGLGNPATRASSRHRGGLRQIKPLVGKRLQDVIGEPRRTRIRDAVDRRIAAFGDVEPGRRLMEELHVVNLVGAVDGDGRRQILAEEFSLILIWRGRGETICMSVPASRSCSR
jgi:hypothetical protein